MALINLTDVRPDQMPDYYEITKQLWTVKRRLINEYNKLFKAYTMSSYITDILEKEISTSDEVRFIDELHDSYQSFKLTTSDQESTSDIVNRLYYHTGFEVGFLVYHQVAFNPKMFSMFIFATDENHARTFSEYLIDEYKKNRQKKMVLITEDSRTVNYRMVERDKTVSREDVYMDEDIKDEFFRSVDEFFNSNGEFYKKYKLPYKRGVLLYGAPGNGKTTIIKSLLSTVDCEIYSWQVSEFTNSNNIIDIFEKITGENRMGEIGSCILVIEDIDSLPERCRSTFLNCLDGSTRNEGVYVIGTTNYPEKIDSALLNRAGRFDRTYEIKKPTEDLRREYLVDKGICDIISEKDLNFIIANTKEFSMSMMNEIFASCALDFHHKGSVDVTKLIKDLKDISNKQKKGNFEDKPTAVGFVS